MHENLLKIIQKHSFWVVLLCHLLFFLSLVLTWNSQLEFKEKPSLYIPSYVYHEPSHSSVQQNNDSEKEVETSPSGIEKRAVTQSHAIPRPNQLREINASRNVDGVHLIGEKKIDNKLLEFLGKALTARLVYPKSAIDFNVKGRSTIGFLVSPGGMISDIQLLESSGAEVLDNAALAATNAISPVKTVDPYLKGAQYLVIGFIFN